MRYIVLIVSALIFLFVSLKFITTPVEYLVTITHELGHSGAAVATGGDVNLVEISPQGGGFAQTSGGNRPTILMFGYLGSILFANLFIFFGFTNYKISRIVSITLFLFFTYSAIFLFNSWGSSLIQMACALFFLLFGWKLYKWSHYVLISLGTMCLIDVLQNFNVHPKSDLQMYSQIMGGNPDVWMYLWLILALTISSSMAYLLYKMKKV